MTRPSWDSLQQNKNNNKKKPTIFQFHAGTLRLNVINIFQMFKKVFIVGLQYI